MGLLLNPADKMVPLKEGDVLFIDNEPSVPKTEPKFALFVVAGAQSSASRAARGIKESGPGNGPGRSSAVRRTTPAEMARRVESPTPAGRVRPDRPPDWLLLYRSQARNGGERRNQQ